MLIALVALVTVPLAARAPAQQSDKLGEIQKKQTENTAEIEDAENELQGIQAQRQELQLSIQTLGDQLAQANDQLAQAQADSDRFAVDVFLHLGDDPEDREEARSGKGVHSAQRGAAVPALGQQRHARPRRWRRRFG